MVSPVDRGQSLYSSHVFTTWASLAAKQEALTHHSPVISCQWSWLDDSVACHHRLAPSSILTASIFTDEPHRIHHQQRPSLPVVFTEDPLYHDPVQRFPSAPTTTMPLDKRTRHKRMVIFSTFFLCCFGASLLAAALATENWFEANCRSSINESYGHVNFGMFEGKSFIFQYTQRTHYLKGKLSGIRCLSDELSGSFSQGRAEWELQSQGRGSWTLSCSKGHVYETCCLLAELSRTSLQGELGRTAYVKVMWTEQDARISCTRPLRVT